MRNKGQLYLGGLLIFLGLLFVIDSLNWIDFGDIFWPLLFIGVGLLIIMRPRMVSPDTNVEVRLIGDVRRMGSWDVKDVEFWSFIGDVKLDMRQATVSTGETVLKMYGFIGDLKILIPEGVAVSVNNLGFITESRVLGHRMGGFLTPIDWQSEDYASASKKLNIELVNFIGGVKVNRG